MSLIGRWLRQGVELAIHRIRIQYIDVGGERRMPGSRLVTISIHLNSNTIGVMWTLVRHF